MDAQQQLVKHRVAHGHGLQRLQGVLLRHAREVAQPAKQHHVVVRGEVKRRGDLRVQQVRHVQVHQRRAAQLLQQRLHGGQLHFQLWPLCREPVKAIVLRWCQGLRCSARPFAQVVYGFAGRLDEQQSHSSSSKWVETQV